MTTAVAEAVDAALTDETFRYLYAMERRAPAHVITKSEGRVAGLALAADIIRTTARGGRKP